MNKMTVDQFNIIIDKLLALKTGDYGVEISRAGYLLKIQGRFGNYQRIQIEHDVDDKEFVVVIKSMNNEVVRRVKYSFNPFRSSSKFYRSWRRLQKVILNRVNNKDFEDAQNAINEVSDVICTMFPEIAEKALLGEDDK